MTKGATKGLKIGGASGYWGESAMATPQLLSAGGLDFIVYDYLAEITMSILARARAKDPNLGYATDFISGVLRPFLPEIARQGVKIVSNAGGVNPKACGEAARALVKEMGLDLKVAVVFGDDLIDQRAAIAEAAPPEMFTGAAFPDPEKIASANVYLGAFPIAKALDEGADIVITGRVVDSAVTLGPCIHHFGWRRDEFDLLAAGSLAGHILECGPQATGGNFTDWEAAGSLAEIGYPIAEISGDGQFDVTKPEGTGGIVSKGTIAEQLVYEIGDPQAYLLPDVTADFSYVEINETGKDRVRVSGARGRAPSPDYKTCVTYEDGFRAGVLLGFTGIDADRKARAFADAAFARTRAMFRKFNAGDFTETSVEVLGAETQYGAFSTRHDAREVVLKIGAKHPSFMGAGLLLKEIAGLGLATPPGLSIFSAGRPKPSPVIRLFSYLTPKSEIDPAIELDGQPVSHTENSLVADRLADGVERPAPPTPLQSDDALTNLPLIKLAFGRSGDKGDKANIGIIARKPEYMPYIWAALSEEAVAARFAHFIEGDDKTGAVTRYLLPGLPAINFLIDRVLGGGGVASLRNDPQGKAYAQLLLDFPIPLPSQLASQIS